MYRHDLRSKEHKICSPIGGAGPGIDGPRLTRRVYRGWQQQSVLSVLSHSADVSNWLFASCKHGSGTEGEKI